VQFVCTVKDELGVKTDVVTTSDGREMKVNNVGKSKAAEPTANAHSTASGLPATTFLVPVETDDFGPSSSPVTKAADVQPAVAISQIATAPKAMTGPAAPVAMGNATHAPVAASVVKGEVKPTVAKPAGDSVKADPMLKNAKVMLRSEMENAKASGVDHGSVALMAKQVWGVI
jgi:hypothetical protein